MILSVDQARQLGHLCVFAVETSGEAITPAWLRLRLALLWDRSNRRADVDWLGFSFARSVCRITACFSWSGRPWGNGACPLEVLLPNVGGIPSCRSSDRHPEAVADSGAAMLLLLTLRRDALSNGCPVLLPCRANW